MLVDSHCHLDFPELAEDLDGVLARAAEAGVGVMQTICTRLSKFPEVLALAQAHDNLYCSVGIHPHNVDDEPPATADTLIDLARADAVIGIGETGLDYFYDYGPQALQRDSFRVHAAAARESGLPLIVHTRDADEDTIEILGQEMRAGAFKGLIHCFSTSRELAERAVELGLYISVAGIVTFKKAEALREALTGVPLDRLLVETDAPYLAPAPKRGKRNEPAFVIHTAARRAEIKGVHP
ncbi:MAG: TatD family hydrolase, partial [Proteobacteria bacterium]|nr:TatD family hydrolase [Pseudomonadota bacterium]